MRRARNIRSGTQQLSSIIGKLSNGRLFAEPAFLRPDDYPERSTLRSTAHLNRHTPRAFLMVARHPVLLVGCSLPVTQSMLIDSEVRLVHLDRQPLAGTATARKGCPVLQGFALVGR